MKQQKNWPPRPAVVQPKPGRLQTQQPYGARVVQPTATHAGPRTPPAALPAYRPQPTPKVLQRKQAVPAQAAPARTVVQRKTPAAPPVYKPNPAPRVLQPKAHATPAQTQPAAPAVPRAGGAGSARNTFTARQPQASARQITQTRPHVVQPLLRGESQSPARPHARTPPGAIQCYKLGSDKEKVKEYALTLWGNKELVKRVLRADVITNSSLAIIAQEKAAMSKQEVRRWGTGLKDKLKGDGHIDDEDLETIQEVFEQQISVLKGSTTKSKRMVKEKEDEIKISEVSTLGIPPSVAVKMQGESNESGSEFKKKVEAYKKKKVENQKTKYNGKHIKPTDDGVSGFLSSVSRTGASNVSVHLIVGASAQTLVSDDSYEAYFKLPFSEHNHDITPSQNDGEVSVLSKALAACVKDFKSNQGSKDIKHKVALGGPYGACDGCKDRIKMFKKLWREAAKNNECEGTLVVTYFYRNPSAEFRSGKTLYGWAEAVRPGTGEDFNYRTTGTKWG